ncbi:tyrosine-type recombinase/integrase [Gellertiella hungarica]|uniref:Integrase n=2 Tax=Gellertiella hungarica TaxID=1572859 RepID=A0A7W6J3R0_9HYPH|nr:tyrosine-type recombinase/integrase [Gellertiella hungarica]MBB4064229.1 integrase [Gellertiella hungarica]
MGYADKRLILKNIQRFHKGRVHSTGHFEVHTLSRSRAPTYLERMNNGGWRVSVPVPRELVKAIGKTRLKRSLETHSQAEAERKKHAVVAEFLAMIQAAREGRLPKATVVGIAAAPSMSDRELTSLALDLRSNLQSQHEGTDDFELEKEGIFQVAERIRGPEIGVDEETDSPVFDPHSEKKAGQFLRVALGKETPVREPLDLFHAQVKWSPRTKSDSGRAINALEDWCKDKRVPFVIEAITRKRAGQFIGDLAANPDRPLTNRTINKYLSCLSQFWFWLEKRGYVELDSSPWSRQSLPKVQPKEDEKERPFTDDEMLKLFSGQPNQPYLKDVMLIGALTGARIDAIISLKRKDITEDGNIRFKPQKREKASRLVPIHSALKSTMERLVKGKQPDDDLFPECPPVAADKPQERSMPAVKAFTYYRRASGIVDPVEGKRRDRVNFHSFRRWFITKALQAGQPELVVQIVVGHKPQSVAANVYLGGLTIEQMIECVEAVKLPSALTE